MPLRARQIELRLQRARQLLADSNAKVINIAYNSGYRHLGLFNAMFKKRFGVTPSEWRQQNALKNPPCRPEQRFADDRRSQLAARDVRIFFSLNVRAQTIISTNGDSPAVAKARAALYQKMAEQDAADKQARIQAENERCARKRRRSSARSTGCPLPPTPGRVSRWKNIR